MNFIGVTYRAEDEKQNVSLLCSLGIDLQYGMRWGTLVMTIPDTNAKNLGSDRNRPKTAAAEKLHKFLLCIWIEEAGLANVSVGYLGEQSRAINIPGRKYRLIVLTQQSLVFDKHRYLDWGKLCRSWVPLRKACYLFLWVWSIGVLDILCSCQKHPSLLPPHITKAHPAGVYCCRVSFSYIGRCHESFWTTILLRT